MIHLYGNNQPVGIGEAFRYIFEHGNFLIKTVEGHTTDLMSFLPYIRMGFGLNESIHYLFLLYIGINRLWVTGSSFKLDKILTIAFNGEIPASILMIKTGLETNLFSMGRALELKIITKIPNTFQYLKNIECLRIRPDNISFDTNIQTINLYTVDVMESEKMTDMIDFFRKEDIRKAVMAEYDIIRAVYETARR